MRFCHISTFYPPYHFGGDAILTQSICEGLLRRGHDVTVVHSLDAYEFLGETAPALPVDPPGLTRRALRSGFGALTPIVIQQTGRPTLLGRQLRDVLSNEFDVVHFHNVSLIGGPGVLTLSHAPVTLYTTHEHWLLCTTHVLWKNREKPCDHRECFSCALRSGIPPQVWRLGGHVARCLEHVDAILAPSQFAADQHRAFGITRPIHVLPSFTHFAPGTPLPSSAAPRPFVYAGRLTRSKGVEQLLDTFAARPALRLLVVGDGPLMPTLRERYARATHIELVGDVPHARMPSLFGQARAVVMPCWGPEVFPLTALESMICGTPVIVRRAGGSAEAVERTGGGLVYDEPQELGALVDQLAVDDALHAALSARALAGTTADYLEDSWMTAYLACIAGLRHARLN